MDRSETAGTDSPALQLIEEREISAAEDAAIRELLRECFPADVAVFSRTRHWQGAAPAYTVIHRCGGRVIAHVGAVVREIGCGRQAAVIFGIQNFAVHPHARGTGLGRAILAAAAAEAARRGIRHGLLFCRPALERYYAALGWRKIDVPVTMELDPGQVMPISARSIAMVLALADEPLPRGAIHLRGPEW